MAEQPVSSEQIFNRVYKGKAKTGDNVDGLVMLGYVWNGTSWQRAGAGAGTSERYDYSGNPIYIGSAAVGTLETDSSWTITAYDLSSPSDSTAMVATGTAWTNRTSGVYA